MLGVAVLVAVAVLAFDSKGVLQTEYVGEVVAVRVAHDYLVPQGHELAHGHILESGEVLLGEVVHVQKLLGGLI